MRWAVPLLVALALTGCETTAEKSARLQRAAKAHEAEARGRTALAQRAVAITRESTKIKITATAVVHDPEGTAAVVTLRNVSATPLRAVPIAITVRDARGSAVYANNTPGQAVALVSAGLLPAHGELTWIDDQIQVSAKPASISARVGEGAPVVGAVPQLSVEGVHPFEDPSSGPGAEGTVVNHSTLNQAEVIVYAIARRGGKIVAAGRAVLPLVAAGAKAHFQLYFVGDPRGAQLQVSAPPTTLG